MANGMFNAFGSGSSGGGGYFKGGSAAPYGVGTQAGGGAQGQGMWSALSEGAMDLLQDRNFQMLVTQMASQIDPQGVGRIMGKPAQRYFQRSAQQESMQQLLKMLGEGGQLKQGPDGSVEYKVGKPSPETEDTSSGLEDEDFDLDAMLGTLSGMNIE